MNDVDVMPPEKVVEITNVLQAQGHQVTTTSKKQNKVKSFKVDTDEDIDKLGKMLCGTQNKHSEREVNRLQRETEIEDAIAFVERKLDATVAPPNTRKVWCMVDSGSFVTIANCPKVFPGHVVQPSAASAAHVKYSDASGGDIWNRGEVVITHILDEMNEIDIPFQDGDVKVPIISVKDFVKKGSIVLGGWPPPRMSQS